MLLSIILKLTSIRVTGQMQQNKLENAPMTF